MPAASSAACIIVRAAKIVKIRTARAEFVLNKASYIHPPEDTDGDELALRRIGLGFGMLTLAVTLVAVLVTFGMPPS